VRLLLVCAEISGDKKPSDGFASEGSTVVAAGV
jgi:hypothetical protein